MTSSGQGTDTNQGGGTDQGGGTTITFGGNSPGSTTDSPPPLQVTPEELTTFASTATALASVTAQAQGALVGISLKAGNFKDGLDMATTAGDESGRAATFYSDLGSLTRALTTLGDNLTAIANKYSTVEDLNTNISTEIGNLVGQVGPELPQTSTSPSG